MSGPQVPSTPEGRSAIEARIALEARRLLAHTNLPASTIAIQLGFRDPSNFSTFFTRQTRQTPTAFRRDQQQTERVVAMSSA